MLYILIPIYNEQDNLELLCKNLHNVLSDYSRFYVFSDDGSKDQSVKHIKELFKNDRFVVLGDGNNHGPGYAFNTGLEWILGDSKNENDKILTLEADNTSDISIATKMIKISELGYDLVLASVYAQGGGFDKTSFFRKLISSLGGITMRYFFDIKVLTLSSFYRIYNVSLVMKIKASYGSIIKEQGFVSMIEILIKAIKLKASIIEVPMVLYSKKRKGKSKMKIFKTTFRYIVFLIRSKSNKKLS